MRNATGNPLAGFDPHEVVDTRPFTTAIQDYVTGRGLHSSTFRLFVSALSSIGGGLRGCLGGDTGY